MKIVIDIPEQAYEVIKRNALVTHAHNLALLTEWIAEGTPLPKGHGRLIDADKIEWFGCNFEGRACIESKGDCSVCNYADCYAKQVRELPTIIEADKEGAE